MQFTPAGASAAHQKLGAGPPGRPVEAASAGGAPEHARVAQLPIPRPSGRASRVPALQPRCPCCSGAPALVCVRGNWLSTACVLCARSGRTGETNLHP